MYPRSLLRTGHPVGDASLSFIGFGDNSFLIPNPSHQNCIYKPKEPMSLISWLSKNFKSFSLKLNHLIKKSLKFWETLASIDVDVTFALGTWPNVVHNYLTRGQSEPVGEYLFWKKFWILFVQTTAYVRVMYVLTVTWYGKTSAHTAFSTLLFYFAPFFSFL